MPLGQALAWTAAIIIPIFWLIYLVLHRVDTNQPLFSGPATPTRRIVALFLGILLAAIAILAPIEARMELGFVALLLLLYAAGAGSALQRIQAPRGHPVAPRPIGARLQYFLPSLIAIAVVTIAVLVLFGRLLTNPVGQIILVALFLIGAILAIPLSLASLLKHFRNLF